MQYPRRSAVCLAGCLHVLAQVVFGEVLEGMDLVKTIEALGSDEGTPTKQVSIASCGAL